MSVAVAAVAVVVAAGMAVVLAIVVAVVVTVLVQELPLPRNEEDEATILSIDPGAAISARRKRPSWPYPLTLGFVHLHGQIYYWLS